MFKKMSLPFLGFLQSSGLVAYIISISAFFTYVPEKFDNGSAEFLAPIIMLLLFVISAVISALLVAGRAGVLFWEKKYKEAFTLISWTIGWGALYFLLFVTMLYIF
jgi:predicted membrane protein